MPPIPRRRVLRAVAAVLAIAAGVFSVRGPAPPPATPAAPPRPHVAVVNGNRWHQNGYAALLYSLSTFDEPPETLLFRRPPSFGIGSVTAPWFSGRTLQYRDFYNRSCDFDVAIFGTAPFDARHPTFFGDQVEALAKCTATGKLRSVFLIHNADTFSSSPRAGELLRRFQPATVLTVGPHTAAAVRADMLRLGLPGADSVDYFVTASPAIDPGRGLEQRSGLVVQGKLDARRRDYPPVFSGAREIPAGSPLLPIRLLGTAEPPNSMGHVPLPPDLLSSGRIVAPFAADPADYPEFYGEIAAGVALLPAFTPLGPDGRSYARMKSSSTVPASLIALTPLVASAELLRTYAYLPAEATLRSEDGTVEGAARALERADYPAVLGALEKARGCVMRRNREVLLRAVQGRKGGPLPDRYCG
ncbi:hypothetical protein DFJ74DRAFT_767775 [Hyaloraphidium curvatum]|nr:hypothetical protein DFJ74DRAFT_767775 [Hyaloraphidium curvatum]